MFGHLQSVLCTMIKIYAFPGHADVTQMSEDYSCPASLKDDISQVLHLDT